HPSYFDRTDPGLDHPLRPQPVPHQALAPIRQLHALHRGQERLGLRLDGLGKQPACAAPQDGRQRVVDRLGLTEWDNGAIPRHRVSFLREVQAGFHPPRYAALLTKPSPSFGHSSTAPAARFRNELEDYMSEEYADETLKAVVSWGRYAELFAYN